MKAPSVHKGFALVEAMVGMAISAVLLVSFTALAIESRKAGWTYTHELRARMYLAEAIESAKDLEVSNWGQIISPDCAYPEKCHPEILSDAWILEAGEEMLDNEIFTRSLSVHEVRRNMLTFPNEIVATGGVLDPDTKKVKGIISWSDAYGNRILELETYVYKP